MGQATSTNPVLWRVDERGVAYVTLNRPQVYNAYNGDMIAALLAAFDKLSRESLRVAVITGNGRNFQAGANINWLDAVRRSSPQNNLRASRMTAEAIKRLNMLPIPIVALVQGACFGGGTGMIAACDIVIAADNAIFSIAEVRIGVAGTIIIPQLSDAIGVRQVRRYALTAERFEVREAHRIGLVHEIVPLADLQAAGLRLALGLEQSQGRHVRRTGRRSRRRTPIGRSCRRTCIVPREAPGTLESGSEAKGLNAKMPGLQCPLWVISGHFGMSERCQLYLSKRTFGSTSDMSAKGHKRAQDSDRTTTPSTALAARFFKPSRTRSIWFRNSYSMLA